MFRRLEELLRQIALAAKVMGSEDLERKFEESLVKVKRGMLYFNTVPSAFPQSSVTMILMEYYRYCGSAITVLVVFCRPRKIGPR